MSNTINIGIITRSMMTGGAEQHVLKLCQSISPKEFKISLFLLIRDEPGDLVNDIPSYVDVFCSPYSRHHPLCLLWLAKLFRKQHIQLTHSFLWAADVYASVNRCLLPNIPHIMSERGDRSYPYYTATHRLLDKLLTFKFSDKACANSHFGKQLLSKNGYPLNRIEVIHNGIDLKSLDHQNSIDIRKELNIQKNVLLIGMVSRLEWIKGGDILLRSISELKGMDIACLFIGEGKDQRPLMKLSYDLGIANKVFFVGRKHPVIPWIKGLDITVLLTRTSEHCSNSILEYMACKRPVIATSVGGNPELVTYETGLLIPPEDSASLTDAIQKLISNPELMKQMGNNGRLRIETNFRMEKIASHFSQLWTDTVNE